MIKLVSTAPYSKATRPSSVTVDRRDVMIYWTAMKVLRRLWFDFYVNSSHQILPRYDTRLLSRLGHFFVVLE